MNKINWKKNVLNVEVRLFVKKMLLLVGVLACQNYQRSRSTIVIVCAKTVFWKNTEKRFWKQMKSLMIYLKRSIDTNGKIVI